MFKCHYSIICKLKFTVFCCLCYYMDTNRQCDQVHFVPTHFLAWEEPCVVKINATVGICGWTVETSKLVFLCHLYCSCWLLLLPECYHSTQGPFGHSPFSFSVLSGWSLHRCVLGMNAPMRSLTVSPAGLPPLHLLPQHLSRSLTHSLTHPQRVLHICLDVRRGGHFCLYERTVDVSSVLYTI